MSDLWMNFKFCLKTNSSATLSSKNLNFKQLQIGTIYIEAIEKNAITLLCERTSTKQIWASRKKMSLLRSHSWIHFIEIWNGITISFSITILKATALFVTNYLIFPLNLYSGCKWCLHCVCFKENAQTAFV